MAALTLWSLFSIWLLFPHVGAPSMLRTAAALLMWLEFAALLTWGYASRACERPFCESLADTAQTAAAVDLPGLTAALLTIGAAYAARGTRARRTPGRLSRTRR